ncbi:hypothetical protein B0J17DRAFT_636284 [Rhizoctonia solani]|nr:hypothetical protein B0J17DRAFT_636284 [Rhizoctonia solani]
MSTSANDSTCTSTFPSPDQSYQITSTHRDYLQSRSPPQNPPKSSGSYASIGSHRSSPRPTSVAGSRAFSDPFSSSSSQTSPFTRTAEISSEPNYTSTPLTPAQYHQFSSTTQHQTGFDTSYSTSFGGTYRTTEGPASTQSELTDTSRVQPSYNDQWSYYPAYDDSRGSISNSISNYHRIYHTAEPQDNDVYGQTIEQTATATSHYSASPTATHTPSPRRAPTAQEPTSPRLRGVGSTEAVHRRVGILLRSQKRQQTEQIERTSIKYPSDGRRGKLSPTSDVNEEAGKWKDPLAKYKAAYERVRLQRNFYEQVASSLVRQVEMLGGDPMQSSERASKGEDVDPKRARVSWSRLAYDAELFTVGYSIVDPGRFLTG